MSQLGHQKQYSSAVWALAQAHLLRFVARNPV